MDYYINFHLFGAFRVKILDELDCTVHFMGIDHFAKLGFEPFEAYLRF